MQQRLEIKNKTDYDQFNFCFKEIFGFKLNYFTKAWQLLGALLWNKKQIFLIVKLQITIA